MGDVRFDPHYARVRDATDRLGALREMDEAQLVSALAGAAQAHDPYLANVLATEVENRVRQATAVAAASPSALLALDAYARVTYANDAALIMLHCRRADLIGHDAGEVVRAFDEGGERIPHEKQPFRDVLAEGAEARGEFLVKRRDGTVVRVRYHVKPLRGESGVTGAVMTLAES